MSIAKFTFDEIKHATGAKPLFKNDTRGEFAVNTDTRTIKPGEIFLPLKGENFDGHNFIETALNNGATAYFTNDKNLVFKSAKFAFFVEDPLTAYLRLARYYRRKINPITISITGSSGKTTTKEMMASVSETQFRTHKSPLNNNNEIGLAKTILSMPEDTEILVLEMGMRGLGEIELLAKYAESDIAIIANVGTAHIGRLKTKKNIAKAKCEITKHLHEEGTLIAHDNPLIHSVLKFEGNTIYFSLEKGVKISERKAGLTKFSYKNKLYTLNIEGDFNVENALAVIEAAKKLGISQEKISQGLENYAPIEKRWETEKIKGLNVINDSYNANPDSVKAVLQSFLGIYKSPVAIVLGDMGELGKDERKYHKEIGAFLSPYKSLKLLCVGPLARLIAKESKNKNAKCFADNKTCAKYILDNIKNGTTILLKASRACRFEEIIEEMKK